MTHLRKMVGLVAVLLLAGCAAKPPVTPPPPPPVKDWTITVTFNYDFTNFVPCSATVTKGCITGFTWGYLQSGASIPLKTSAVTVCTGVTQPETCTDVTNSTLGIGPITYYAIANGIDNNGAAVSSTPGTSPVDNVTLIAPANVNATRK